MSDPRGHRRYATLARAFIVEHDGTPCAQARLTELRRLGYDGPAIWAVEAKVNRLLDEWAVSCRGL